MEILENNSRLSWVPLEFSKYSKYLLCVDSETNGTGLNELNLYKINLNSTLNDTKTTNVLNDYMKWKTKGIIVTDLEFEIIFKTISLIQYFSKIIDH
jgi:hypothetical protein